MEYPAKVLLHGVKRSAVHRTQGLAYEERISRAGRFTFALRNKKEARQWLMDMGSPPNGGNYGN